MKLRRRTAAIGIAAAAGVGIAIVATTIAGPSAAACDPTTIIADNPLDQVTGPDLDLPEQNRTARPPCPPIEPPRPDFVNVDGTINTLLVPEYMPVATDQGPMVNAAGVQMCVRTNLRPPAPPAIAVNGPDPVVGEDVDGREWAAPPGPPMFVPCPATE